MQKCFLGFFILVLTTHNLGIVVKILGHGNEPGSKESKISITALVTCLQIDINFVIRLLVEISVIFVALNFSTPNFVTGLLI